MLSFNWFTRKNKPIENAATPAINKGAIVPVSKEKSLVLSPAKKDIDALGLLEERLNDLTLSLGRELKRWHNIKIEIESVCSQPPSAEHKAEESKSIVSKIKEFIQLLKELIEAPDVYLKELIQKVEPHLDELRIKILALAQHVDESENDKQKRNLEICFAGIELIYGLQLIVNDVKNEIEYCLDFEKLSEQARARLIDYIVGGIIGINFHLDDRFDFARYRLGLYHKIHQQIEHIEKFITDSQAILKKSIRFLNENKFHNLTKDKIIYNHNMFWTPAQNIRDATNKFETHEMKRTQSYNALL